MSQTLAALAVWRSRWQQPSCERSAQPPGSPHETVKATVDGANITHRVRPAVHARPKIMGGLVPYGRVWRTGADEATTLTTDKALVIGGDDRARGQGHAVHAARRRPAGS